MDMLLIRKNHNAGIKLRPLKTVSLEEELGKDLGNSPTLSSRLLNWTIRAYKPPRIS